MLNKNEPQKLKRTERLFCPGVERENEGDVYHRVASTW